VQVDIQSAQAGEPALVHLLQYKKWL
jgi:hypothetical protein